MNGFEYCLQQLKSFMGSLNLRPNEMKEFFDFKKKPGTQDYQKKKIILTCNIAPVCSNF